ncbi:MAG: Gldg family protein [Clostridia bacterium]|nr:Gldg family protein [Clostridia bacterium]
MSQKNKNAAVRDNRRYKYGGISILFTVVFIAFILVVNVFLSSLSLSGSLTVDLTKEDFTSIGDETLRLLDELGKDLDITVTFMSPRDRFYDTPGEEYNGLKLEVVIRDLAEAYQKIYDGSGERGTVRIEYKELDTDPEFEKKILEETATPLTANSVIVEGEYHKRVLDLSSFLMVNENGEYYAFNGEYRLTTAILQSSIKEQQVVTFTYGNGEPITENGEISTSSPLLGLIYEFSSAGFSIETVNLDMEEIDPNTEILITYDPVNDLSLTEVDKISEFLKARNAYMVFVDSQTTEHKNLQSMLSDNWGIDYNPLYRITDDTHSLEKSASTINAKFAAISADAQNSSAAYQIRKTVSSVEGSFTVAFPESVELVVRNNNTQDGFTVETVLSTYDTAKATKKGNDGTEIEGTKGEMPLMLLSTKYGYGVNNATEYSYVMLVGSTEFANTANILQSTYGNRRIVLSAARVFSANRIVPDIDYKEFQETALEIENGTAKTLTYLICTIFPGAIIIMGIVVFFRRRHL